MNPPINYRAACEAMKAYEQHTGQHLNDVAFYEALRTYLQESSRGVETATLPPLGHGGGAGTV